MNPWQRPAVTQISVEVMESICDRGEGLAACVSSWLTSDTARPEYSKSPWSVSRRGVVRTTELMLCFAVTSRTVQQRILLPTFSQSSPLLKASSATTLVLLVCFQPRSVLHGVLALFYFLFP